MRRRKAHAIGRQSYCPTIGQADDCFGVTISSGEGVAALAAIPFGRLSESQTVGQSIQNGSADAGLVVALILEWRESRPSYGWRYLSHFQMGYHLMGTIHGRPTVPSNNVLPYSGLHGFRRPWLLLLSKQTVGFSSVVQTPMPIFFCCPKPPAWL